MRDQFYVWLKSLVRYGNDPNNYLEWRIDELKENINDDGDSEYLGLVILYTRTHSYSIKARVQTGQPSYLGCIASVRKPLAGETHTRGNDLADGYSLFRKYLRIQSFSPKVAEMNIIPKIDFNKMLLAKGHERTAVKYFLGLL